jgi:hypothetical protein
MNTSALTLGIPAVLVAAGLLFTSQDTDRASSESTELVAAELTSSDDEPGSVPLEGPTPIWIDNLALASSIAAKGNRPMMVVFR